jgi:IPT/TIG domain
MKSNVLEKPSVVYLLALLAVVIPMTFTACGGTMAPANTAQQNSGPTVASVVPDSGPPAGGKLVTITGSNFTAGTQQTSPSVSFGGVQATHVTVLSPTQLSAMIPAHTAGTVTVQVTNPDGESTSLAAAFTYSSASLALNSVSPISGPADGGTTVTIYGANFQSGMSVTFGGLAATSVSTVNATTIQAQTPAHTFGPVSVTVTNPGGQSTSLSSGFNYHSTDLYWSAPSSTAVPVIGYNIYRSGLPTGPYAKLNGAIPIAESTFTDGTVHGSSTYYYEVKSVDSSGNESSPAGPVPASTGP